MEQNPPKDHKNGLERNKAAEGPVLKNFEQPKSCIIFATDQLHNLKKEFPEN